MKKLIFSIAAVSFFTIARGQSEQPGTFQSLINVDTKSPDVAALGKFGNIPVNECTGATDITIPIFHINIGKMDLPISLDYHTGGIRVDESASSVGLGWALSGIGVVSRNVVNIPDEDVNGYLSSPPPDSLYNDWVHGGGQYGDAIDVQYATWLNEFRQGGAEADPDIYSYNINGQSGKFLILRDLSIMQIPLSNNLIFQAGGGFRITDANGIIYIFDITEHTEVPMQSVTEFYVGSWRLSKMIDPDLADTVFFSYDQSGGVSTDHLYAYAYNFLTASDCDSKGQPGEQFHVNTINRTDERFPSQISWRGGKIQFSNVSDRSDRSSEERLDHINVYSVVKGQQVLIKTVQLYQSYFGGTPSTQSDERNYRLRLDAVSVLPTSGNIQPQTWRMTYNNSPMAPRESANQDIWGFNNGKQNSSLIPEQTVYFGGTAQIIEPGNSRDANAGAMQACIISSIQYPTGGKSVFEFEPHQWLSYFDYTEPEYIPCAAYSQTSPDSKTTFTIDPLGSNYNMTYYFSSYNYLPSGANYQPQRPYATVTDQTTGQQTMISANSDPTQSLSTLLNPVPWTPIPGHTYTVEVNLNTPAGVTSVNAQFYVNWTRTYGNVPKTNIGGGLRIKSVTNYDQDGTVIGKDVYKYGLAEDGNGQLLTPANYLQVTSRRINYECSVSVGTGNPADGISCIGSNGDGLTIYANPVFPATQFMGSPVLYPSVTKYQLDAQGYPSNGKSVFAYRIYDDQPAFATTDYQGDGVLMILNDWKNGHLFSQSDYKYDFASSSYIPVKITTNDFEPARGATYNGLKVENVYTYLVDECHDNSMLNATTEYKMFQIPTNTGAMLNQSRTVTTYGTNGTPLTVSETYSYNDLTHLFATSKATVDSKKIPDVTNMKYPHDLASGTNVYAEMLAKNIISPVVQSQRLYNGIQSDLHNLNFMDWTGTGNLLLPGSVDEQVRSNPIETRYLFNQYDKYGNILQQQKAGDMFQSYIWDYTSVYPIAKCSNAAVSSIAATSFEADGTGGWTTGGTTPLAGGVTGNQYYLLNSDITMTGLASSTNYIVSYWSNRGAYSISGTSPGYPIKGKSVSIGGVSWTYYEHLITGQNSVQINGSGGVDELRLYPANALMTTYTYAPLVGMTSQCDEANRITYFEYDELERLRDIKDQDGNVIKTYDYHYHAAN